MFPRPSWKILLGSRQTSVTEKELPIHTFPTGGVEAPLFGLTPTNILFWWKCTSQKTSNIGFHSPDCWYLSSEWLSPWPHAISPLLNGFQELPWRHPPCCLSPWAPLSSHPHLVHRPRDIWGGCWGFHAQCRGSPGVRSSRQEPASPPAIRVNLESGFNWLCLSFYICEMRVIVPQPTEPLWELGETIHANTLNCTWCVVSTKYVLLLLLIM